MIAAIAQDITGWVMGAALAGGAIGFMACAVMASGRIRRNQEEYFQEGYECCNRDHRNARTNPLRSE